MLNRRRCSRLPGHAIEENVNEHLIRAINIRLIERNIGHAQAVESTAREKKRGYLYIDALCAKLAQYEQQRDKYPTMESYYPELIKVFGTELSAAN